MSRFSIIFLIALCLVCFENLGMAKTCVLVFDRADAVWRLTGRTEFHESERWIAQG